jgi:hypothetical protein
MKERIGIMLAIVAGCALAGAFVISRHHSQPVRVAARDGHQSQPSQVEPSAAAPAPPPLFSPSVPELPAPRARMPKQSVPKVNSAPSPVTRAPARPPQIAGGGGGGAGGGKIWVDPIAREALSSVGVDPVAEAVWADAINDPTLPPNERKDLIEDLNEDGFADPDHVTPADAPLIASRIALIEQAAPFAMDQVNADAFAEAYKDLTNMLAKVSPP